MHEMAVTQSLLDIVLEEASKVEAEKVSRVTLVIGELSGLVDDSIQFYFDFMTKGTIAEGAKLNFTRIPARMKCRACGEESSVRLPQVQPVASRGYRRQRILY